jgi:hypothetical protein
VGAEHSRGDAGYKTAGDEPLAEYSEVVSRTGDDVAFTGSKCAEARTRDFFRCFTIRSGGGDVRLSGDLGEFRFGGARAECADAYAVGFHFFGEAFGEEKVEGFGRGVR